MNLQHCFSIAALFFASSVVNAPTSARLEYSSLAGKYSLEPPPGFKEAMKRDYGEDEPNSCAIRLAFALEAVDRDFFDGFRSRATYQNKPIRARALAAYLTDRVAGGMSISTGAEGRTVIRDCPGIIYFANIRPRPGRTGVSWHISLWDGKSVVDDGDYFDRAEFVQFWPLSR